MKKNKFGVIILFAILMCLFCTVSVWAQGMVPRYRLYNPNNFHHHYTTDPNEYQVLGSIGWVQEGAACYLYNEMVTIEPVDAVPYYRLYNPNSFEHHWTTDANEYRVLGTIGWIQEGVDGYVFAAQVPDSEPLYRLYNPNNGLHLWTMDANEKNVLIGYGFQDEGNACYVFPQDLENQLSVPDITYVLETFDSGPGGFVEFTGISATNGRLRLLGDGTDYTQVTYWDGGANPSHNWYPQSGHSNYFDDFYVSADTYWDSGDIDYIYGLAICLRRDSMGYDEWIRYAITKDGFYNIGNIEDGAYHQIVGWTRSFLLNINGQQNELAAQKQADNYRFFINGYEVENLTVEGFHGGAIGVEASEHVNVSYDNYKVTNAYVGQIVIPSDGYFFKRNEQIYKTMTTTYLWYNRVPQINYQNYESAEDLVKYLRYSDQDRWSYITTEEEYQNLFSGGRYIGLGMGLVPMTNNEYGISFVYNDSPADIAGIVRGDILLAVNGKTVVEIETNNLWDTIFGKDQEGVAVRLKIRKLTGGTLDLILEKRWVNINAVLHHEIIEQNSAKIGYLVFNQFIGTAENEISTVFSKFKQAGITELILDLRYNPGGKLSLAQYLASLIAGNFVDGQIFVKFIHNDNYRGWDNEYKFDKPELALDLNGLVVITTNQSCSASESVINGLQPFIDVVVIGDTTCGKPVGMYGYKIFDMHISPIEFQIQNALGAGDYFDGIPPACYADDSLVRPLGHSEENSLYEALFYLRNGNCSIDPMSLSALRKIESIKAKIKPHMLDGFRKITGAF